MKKLLLTTALLAMSAPAYAANLDYDSYSWSGVGIHITSPNNISGGAGPITLYKQGKVVVADAWCMDVANYLTGSGHDGVLPFDLADADSGLPGVPASLTAEQLGIIGWLVRNGDKATDATLKGAFQVAIWSEEYGASFSYDSLGAAFTSDVTADLNLASFDDTEFGDVKGLNFLVPLDPSVSQTLVFGSVPELSTWAMSAIGFGLVGFAALGRRKNARYAI